MTKEDIIRMAREAGFSVDGDSWVHSPNAILVDGRKSIDKQLTRFAVLVAAAEREQCAKWCLEMVEKGLGTHAWAAAGFIRQGGKDARNNT